MMPSSSVRVQIDLERIRRNTAEVAGNVSVPLWAVIKADAYGLGAAKVAVALADRVEGFCLFRLEEAEAIDLWGTTRKPAITLGPPSSLDPQRWLDAHVRPAVSTVEQATALKSANPILCVDTGMQRFACPPADIDAVIAAGQITGVFTHATRVEQSTRLKELMAGRRLKLHSASSSLLDKSEAHLDLVRPGLALYRGAVNVTTPLAEVRASMGPIGYTAWQNEGGFHGVIIAGYSNGLRPGPVMINGRRQRIAEVGMQSAYVTLDAADRAGDTVVLLGEGPVEAEVAFAWGVTPHHALLTMANMGAREYR
jgi:alanine racemase